MAAAATAGARASLHAHISRLCGLVSSAGVAGAAVLVKAQPGYRLDVPDEAFDLGRFVIDQKAGSRPPPPAGSNGASGHLSAALGEGHGPVLADLGDFEFVEAFAAALTEDKLVAPTVRAEAEIACGRTYSIIRELETLVAEHPYREPLWAQLITAYYLAGRQYDGLHTYGRLKTTLADDLGIDPGQTLRELHRRILRQEPLDIKQAARVTAERAAETLQRRPETAGVRRRTAARCRRTSLSAARHRHPDRAPARQRRRWSTTTPSAATTRCSSTPGTASSPEIGGQPRWGWEQQAMAT